VYKPPKTKKKDRKDNILLGPVVLKHIQTTKTTKQMWPNTTRGEVLSKALSREGYSDDQIKQLIEQGRILLSCRSERIAVKPSQEIYILEDK